MKNKYHIYISGPITLRPTYEEAEREFFMGQDEVAHMFDGERVEIINPCARGIVEGWEWLDYMLEDLWCLRRCTHIYMLKDWELSPGAKIEHAVAVRMELTIMYQK
jgi:hypothetical protein